jgi:hypothetical protein
LRPKKGKNGNGRYLGRPSGCDNIPGEPACLEQLNGPKNSQCQNCWALEVSATKIRIFGKKY